MTSRGVLVALMLVAGLAQLYVAFAGDNLGPSVRHELLVIVAAAWFVFAGVTFTRYRNG